MHNQAIERDLELHCNLPSWRWKVRRIKTGQEKALRCLSREQDQILDAIRRLGYEPLLPPVQRGWKRTFVLRPDVMQDKHADFFQKILDKINTTQYSSRKDFKVKRRRFGKRCYVIRPQHLWDPEEYSFRRMKFTEEEEGYFYKKEESYFPSSKNKITKYVFLEPWRFVLKIEENIITQTRIRDWELERRQKEIDDFLEKNLLYHKLNRLHGYRTGYWKRIPCKKHDNPLNNKPVHEIMDEYYNEL